MSRATILIADDHDAIRAAFRSFLEAHGYAVVEASSAAQAEQVFRQAGPDAAILDHHLPDGDALGLLPVLRAGDPAVGIIIVTGHGTIDLAVQAIKAGADHFLTKPADLPAALVLLERVLERRRERRRHAAEDAARSDDGAPDPFLGEGAVIRRLAETARRLVAVDNPVLILGETGSGKGVLARWLHRHGPRAEESFVDLNCAGLSRELLESELFGHAKGAFTGAATAKQGLLEIGHHGSVFLDEVGDLDPLVQPKLLKVVEDRTFRRLGEVQDRTVDVRIIAATSLDLARLVREQRFRSDLYFRINTLTLTVPPLRERPDDLPLLARQLLRRIAGRRRRREVELADDAMARLRAYPWPGNVRELQNVLERAVLLSDHALLRAADLHFDTAPEMARSVDGAFPTLPELERRHIAAALERTGGNVPEAARLLDVPRSTLYQRIKTLGLGPSGV
ncbi:MAG TPA: sigma-54 dependent transcriptional regulator [Gemmatimonadales bacterium]|nr:sigma-54 dependent transcriptional regulator [Gemmatimonadales bacterium]